MTIKTLHSEHNIQENINRMDHFIMNAYGSSDNVRIVYEKLLHEWSLGGEIRKFSIENGFFGQVVDEKIIESSFLMLRDYFIEPYLLSRMNIFQLEEYFSSIRKSFLIDISCDIRYPDKPILVESIHHSCSFSSLYLLAQYLTTEFDKNNAIIMYQQDILDVRAKLLGDVVQKFLFVKCNFINISGNWYKEYLKLVNDKSIIIYMGDLASSCFNNITLTPGNTRSLHIQAKEEKQLKLEALSISKKLASKLQANHIVVDYPSNNVISIRDFHDGEYLCCPLEQWVFWAGVDVFLQDK